MTTCMCINICNVGVLPRCVCYPPFIPLTCLWLAAAAGTCALPGHPSPHPPPDNCTDTESDATVDREAEAAAVAVARRQEGKGVPVLLSRMEEAESQAAALKGRPSKLRALVEGGVHANKHGAGASSSTGPLKPELVGKGVAQVLSALRAARVGELLGEPYAAAAAAAIEATCREGVASAPGYRSKVCSG